MRKSDTSSTAAATAHVATVSRARGIQFALRHAAIVFIATNASDTARPCSVPRRRAHPIAAPTPVMRARCDLAAYNTAGTSVGRADLNPSMLTAGVVMVGKGKASDTK